jgi:UDPglucose 6-dehydrogenase
MNVAVVGLWHLGCVTAACLAKLGHFVTAYDEDTDCIVNLNKIEPPVYEPELISYMNSAIQANTLRFTNNIRDVSDADVIWVTYDTPVDEFGYANIEGIKIRLMQLFPYFNENTLVIISSQLPVGTTREIEQRFKNQYQANTVQFVYSPENIRLGKAIALFLDPDRVIMGISSEQVKKTIESLLPLMTDKLIWMSVEAAEMTKHAINSFLATSIVFINELALLCERLGVDIQAVERGLKADKRIGENAYLASGMPFSGGTLVRDVNYLLGIGKVNQLPMDLLSTILASNQKHSQWMQQKLSERFKPLTGKKIAILGLAYKSGTNCINQSLMIKIGLWLNEQGAVLKAYDPILKTLPPTLNKIIALQQDLFSALYQADGVVIGAMWPELLNINVEQILSRIQKPYIFDPNGFLSKQLAGDKRIDYYRVGANSW